MNKIVITIHSFVDLITNSSTELFVCATKSTVNAAKAIIDHVTGGRCDELFDVELAVKVTDYYDDDDKYLGEKTFPIDSKEGQDRLDYNPTILVITPKTEDQTYSKLVEEVLKLSKSTVAEEKCA